MARLGHVRRVEQSQRVARVPVMARTEAKLLATCKAMVGKLVRLRFAIRTKGGHEFPAGMRFRVSSTWHGKFVLVGVSPKNEDLLTERKEIAHYVRGVSLSELQLEAVQPA